jgi:alpha-galactosidase
VLHVRTRRRPLTAPARAERRHTNPVPRPRRWLVLLAAASAASVMAVAGPRHAMPQASAATDGAATKPIMGWSSWSFYREGATQATILAQADAMHASLEKYGYTYLNIDSGWDNHYDAYGRPQPNSSKYPNGIAWLAARLHSMGLKLGLYMLPGIPTSVVSANDPVYGTKYHARDIITSGAGNTLGSGYDKIDYSKPGAQAYVSSIVNMFASWGVDYVKLDFVGPGGGNVAADNVPDVEAWNKAITASGRSIVLELSNSLSIADAGIWEKYANGWRIDGDIEDYGGEHGSSYPLTDWSNVTTRFRDLPKWVPYAGPGGWNDLDSLELGNGANDGLTVAQRQSTMTLWAISCAPLLLGTDLTHLDPTDLAMITNQEVIAVDQAGVPASLIGGTATSDQQVWSAREQTGSHVVALFNLSTAATATVSVSWHQLGISGAASVRDLWTHTNLGTFASGFSATLAPGASRMIMVTAG